MTLNDSSTDNAKLSISQRLGTLYAIAKGLEAFGVTITTAQASGASYDYILVFAHDVKAFYAWMKKRNLVPVFEELGEDDCTIRELRWTVSTEFLGMTVQGYLTEDEKEAWENEMDTRDPA